MPHIERIDHKAQAEELMLSQFEDSPNIMALVKSWLTPLQGLEDTLLDFIEGNGITNATGEMLDIIGSWMGVERQGRLDNEYRTAILGRAIIEGMDGTTEKFLEGFRVLINSNQAKFFNYYPKDVYALAGENWNSSLKAELKKIANVTANVNLIIAGDLHYLTPATRGSQDDVLNNESDVDYDMLLDGVLEPWQTTVVDSAEAYGTTSVMGWDGVEFDNESPAAFTVVDYKIVEGVVVDNEGNPVVDDKGNPITHLDQAEI